MTIVWTDEALVDFERIQTFLRFIDDRQAARAAATLLIALRSLELFPGRGRPSPVSGARELVIPFGQSAYVARYAYLADSDEILIVRLWHGREERT